MEWEPLLLHYCVPPPVHTLTVEDSLVQQQQHLQTLELWLKTAAQEHFCFTEVLIKKTCTSFYILTCDGHEHEFILKGHKPKITMNVLTTTIVPF